MTNIERRDSSLAYIADSSVVEQMRKTKKLLCKFNRANTSRLKYLQKLILKIFGKAGTNCNVNQPFYCDYGTHIEVGDNFFANYNCVILDVAKVKMGNNVFLAPNVAIYTAGHPIHPESRNSFFEYGIPITIGNNVWIGGNAVICPGVKIGDNVVIGAGSVVTKNVPSNTVAAGNPCKVIHEITDEDKKFYYKKNEFDKEA